MVHPYARKAKHTLRQLILGRELERRKQAYAVQLRQHREAYQTKLGQFREDYNRNLRELRTEIAALKRELQKATRYELGSYTEGVSSWRQRWERPGDGKRVLLCAPKDYSGSFHKWASAINSYTSHAARLMTFSHHQYDYPTDLLFPHPGIQSSGFLELAKQADVIHIKDETGFFDGSNGLPQDLFWRLDKPLVFTHYGGYARKYQDDEHYRAYVRRFAARIAMTPDLCFPWFDGYFVPHAIDTERYGYLWSDGNLLAHSPSTRMRKGTDDLIAALTGLDLEFDLIHGVPHRECLERKRQANLFFDQAGREVIDTLGVDHVIGWYGNSALEAAVHGIPTIAHLSPEAFAGARLAGKDIESSCAIINTATGPSGIRDTLLAYLRSSPEERTSHSHRTRQWVEDFHSYQAVASELHGIYCSV